MRDPKERLQDVLEAIEHIERYAAYGREEFERSELIQSWSIRHLQIIGEAARALPSEVKEKATSVPWLKIVGTPYSCSRLFRNRHGSSLECC